MPQNEINYEKFKIKDYKHWSLFLYKNQYYLGRVVVWAKREDAIDFISMTPEEREEFFSIGAEVVRVLSALFEPDLMNYASLGNVTKHLHIHVIPRYTSPREFGGITFIDANWGRNYAPYDTEFKVTEETLMRIKDAIKNKL